jgi:beta-glucosidase
MTAQVMSDWDAQHSGVASALAGMDLLMPDAGFWGGNLTEAVRNGSVPMERLDNMVLRNLAPYFYIGQNTPDYPQPSVHSSDQVAMTVNVQTPSHSSLIREMGSAGTVLVKNVNGTLPFNNPTFLNVYGYDAELKSAPWANPSRFGGGYEVNWGWNTLNGTMITAGGSGSSTPGLVSGPSVFESNPLLTRTGNLAISRHSRTHFQSLRHSSLGFLVRESQPQVRQRRCLSRLHQRLC